MGMPTCLALGYHQSVRLTRKPLPPSGAPTGIFTPPSEDQLVAWILAKEFYLLVSAAASHPSVALFLHPIVPTMLDQAVEGLKKERSGRETYLAKIEQSKMNLQKSQEARDSASRSCSNTMVRSQAAALLRETETALIDARALLEKAERLYDAYETRCSELSEMVNQIQQLASITSHVGLL